MILNGIGNSSECIITKLPQFHYTKVPVWHEPHLYLYSLKISSLIVVRNSTRILYPGIVQRVVWLLPSGFAATCPEP